MIQRQRYARWAADTQRVRRIARAHLLVSIAAAWFLALFAPLFCILHCHLSLTAPRPQGAAAIFLCHFSTAGATAGEPAQPPAPLPLPRIIYDLVLASLLMLLPLRAIARVAAGTARAYEHVGAPPPTPPPRHIHWRADQRARMPAAAVPAAP